MKLLTKTSLFYIAISVMLFSAGGIVFYKLVHNILSEEITEHLLLEKDKVLQYMEEKGEIPPPSPLVYDILIFNRTSSPIKEEIKDTFYNPKFEGESLPYRQIRFGAEVNENNYEVLLAKPLPESTDLIETIIQAFVILAASLLAVLFIFNFLLSRIVWKPFQSTLGKLREFDLRDRLKIQLPPTETEEFRLLNDEIRKMTEKMQRDYVSLKEFSENASHEIQTPLAIIRSKIELLMQSEKFSEDEMKLLQEIYESTNRLSKLNQSLLLLSKIENRQFHETQPLNVEKLIDSKLTHFEEMIRFKNITVEKNYLASPEININPQLAEILVSNIIGNAIKHNLNGGALSIMLTEHSLSVSNTGHSLNTSTEKLFERFSKESFAPDSVGLGLAIVKQICDSYGFKAEYSYSTGMHTLTIRY